MPLPPSWYPVGQVSLPGNERDVTQKSNDPITPPSAFTVIAISVAAVGAPVRYVPPVAFQQVVSKLLQGNVWLKAVIVAQ